MATHSSVLAWRIPGTGEPGGLPSLGLHSQTRLKQLSSSSSTSEALSLVCLLPGHIPSFSASITTILTSMLFSPPPGPTKHVGS